MSPRSGTLRRFFANLGPGLTTGAADDDPSGISTYSVVGAAFGYLPLWTAVFSFPLMTAVQLMCARLGIETGLGLAGVIRWRAPSRRRRPGEELSIENRATPGSSISCSRRDGASHALNYAGFDAIKLLFTTAVINGVLAPPLILIVLMLTRDRTAMGSAVNPPLLGLPVWTTSFVMVVATLGLFFAS